MSTPRRWAFLEVQVTFPVINPPSDASVSIKFPEVEQATWYHDYILSKPFHAANNLQSRRRDNAVTVRLPSRFIKISASVRCEGFYFTVSDKTLAEDWVANMLVWQLLPEYKVNRSQAQLGVVRNWSHNPTISHYLLACLPPTKGGKPPPIPPSGHALPPPQNPVPTAQAFGGIPAEIDGAIGSHRSFRPRPQQPPPPPPPLPPRDLGQAVGSRFNSAEDSYGKQAHQGFNGPPQVPPDETAAHQPPKEPPTTMWEVEADLNRWGVSTKLFGGRKKHSSVYGVSMGGKPDRLENHFANRDIVYLVDNASSMANIWGHATYLLRILVWRSLHYNDDGMELKFTIGSDNLNLRPDKKQKVDDFVKKMQTAAPKPNEGKETDIRASLDLILERHFETYRHNDCSPMRRKLTILVLTDGLWARNEGFEVDDYLVNCIQKIPDFEWSPDPNSSAGTDGGRTNPRKPPSRPISIQFIWFGDDEEAIARLDWLDNQLQNRLELAGRALPDVIHTESANGDIYKMFLGSVLEDFDRNPYREPRLSIVLP